MIHIQINKIISNVTCYSHCTQCRISITMFLLLQLVMNQKYQKMHCPSDNFVEAISTVITLNVLLTLCSSSWISATEKYDSRKRDKGWKQRFHLESDCEMYLSRHI